MSDSVGPCASNSTSPYNSDRECTTTCCRYAVRRIQLPTRWQRLRARYEWFDWKVSRSAAALLRHPASAVLGLAIIVLALPGRETPTAEQYQLQGSAQGAPLSITITRLAATTATSFLDALKSRVEQRWTILAALGGLMSLLKIFESVAKSDSRYLTMDLAIESPKPGDSSVLLMTSVENKVEDDRKIHNALLLVGSARRSPADLVRGLGVKHEAIRQRLWCGGQLDTWRMWDFKEDGTHLISNGGQTWVETDGPIDEADGVYNLLSACPLGSEPLVAGSGAELAVIVGLTFYFEENDDIGDERVSFPVALDSRLFASGHPYIARFYIIGEQPYPQPESLSRCTARAFVVPRDATLGPDGSVDAI